MLVCNLKQIYRHCKKKQTPCVLSVAIGSKWLGLDVSVKHLLPWQWQHFHNNWGLGSWWLWIYSSYDCIIRLLKFPSIYLKLSDIYRLWSGAMPAMQKAMSPFEAQVACANSPGHSWSARWCWTNTPAPRHSRPSVSLLVRACET